MRSGPQHYGKDKYVMKICSKYKTRTGSRQKNLIKMFV